MYRLTYIYIQQSTLVIIWGAMNHQDQIRLLALDLEPGQNTRTVCPYCNADHERSLSLSRNDEGVLYHCYRAKCGRKGFLPNNGVNYQPGWEKRTPKKKTAKTFSYATETLPQPLKDMFYARYSITETELEDNGFLYSPEMDRVIMPIYNSFGYEVGKVARSYNQNTAGIKAISYFNDGESHLHYVPSSMHRDGAITCVEDIPSAIRVGRFGKAVAILGSWLPLKHIIELGELTQEINIALDPDAASKAFKMRRAYMIYFRNFNVKLLSNDPKDMTDEQIQEEIFV
jgi:hypothetical protein